MYFKQILLLSGQCLRKIERNAEGFDVIFWLAGYTETNFVNSATYRPRRDSSATVCWFRRSCETGCLAVRGCAGTSAGWRQDRQRTTGCCLYTPHTPCRTSEWVSERVGFKRPPIKTLQVTYRRRVFPANHLHRYWRPDSCRASRTCRRGSDYGHGLPTLSRREVAAVYCRRPGLSSHCSTSLERSACGR